MRVLRERHLDRSANGEAGAAVVSLRASVDRLVVVGTTPSHAGRIIHVRDASDLRRRWFRCCRTIAVVAGPWCLPNQLEEVHRWIRQRG